ncbi:MAG: family 43 glycosylhydrolase [Bacteroidales bacterium]|nr:family 43 glycosylhydrolase [Bacteroidales bacterium]
MSTRRSNSTVLKAALSAAIIVFASSCGTVKQGQSSEASAKRYFQTSSLPDAVAIIPAPVKTDDPRFAGDKAYYEWGKTIRERARGKIAQEDAASSMDYMAKLFEEAIGLRFSEELTPNLYRLLSKATKTSSAANKKAKSYYSRLRPYVEFSEPTGVPEDEESHRKSASYPSGHTTRGWTMALILSELLPERSQDILEVGYRYGASRVIIGYHYQSDVQEARAAASGIVAVLHSSEDFCEDMKKAQKEIDSMSRFGKNRKSSGNPLFPGWYADPEGVVFGNEYWIYPTWSRPFDEQLFMDAFSSRDLVHWTRHEKVISKENISWLRRALWAPSVIEKDGTYYFYFGANDMHEKGEGGIGVAVADNPAGPFKDALGHPLIDEVINGAQPIDQFVFKDDDGSYYMYYGGWRHCNMVRLGDDLTSLVPFEDGTMFKEVTPKGYVEGPFMLKRNGKYYFMWSEGGWTGPDYRVAYAMSNSPFGPFERIGTILESDMDIATGAGHHSVMKGSGKDEYYIVYHRHPLQSSDGNHRVVCIERLYFGQDGKILPVKITFEGVPASKLRH